MDYIVENFTAIKNAVCAGVGVVGGWILSLFGGWTPALGALLALMAADYITGLMVAGVFRKSPKSSGGGLDSRIGYKGLCRKFAILLIVGAGRCLDILVGCDYIMSMAIIGFAMNECISLFENAGLMGLPVPRILRRVLDQLAEQTEQNKELACKKEGE